MNKKRDKQGFIDAIIALAAGKVLTDKEAVKGLTEQGLINPKTTAADTRYVAKLMTELRTAGALATRKDLRAHRKQAIYAFAESMQPVGVRQVAYHLSSEGLIEKKESDFQLVSVIIGEMREADELPWEWVIDNSRVYTPTPLQNLEQTADAIIENQQGHVERIPENVQYWIANAFPSEFYIDEDTLTRPLWHRQPNHVEVWIEKKGLLRVIEPVTEQWEVSLVAAAGQCSKTILHEAAMHHDEIVSQGKQVIVLYFGDYDPAGGAIYRSLQERVERYSRKSRPEFYYQGVTRAQIDTWGLPTRPIDSKRGTAGTKRFTDTEAVDLDAVPADQLRQLVKNSIAEFYDTDIAEQNQQAEQNDKTRIAEAYEACKADNTELISELERIAAEVFERLSKFNG